MRLALILLQLLDSLAFEVDRASLVNRPLSAAEAQAIWNDW